MSHARISLSAISVYGVDTHARAATLRHWVARSKSMRSARIPILRDVTFEAKPGDRIAILGSNGSGKSSLLKVISGNYPIHEGVRDVEGSIVPLIEMGAGFDGEATGRENIKLTYAYRGKLRSYSPDIEEKIIAFSELGDKIDTPLKSYSSGMSARLAFSSAIFQDPDILLLDEIFAAGDAGFTHKSTESIKQQVDRAAITLFVSHNHEEMMAFCNRFILMHQGRIINEGSSKEILRQYQEEILKLSPEHEAAHA
jgi:ABC-type polysaccharide/polyol phosphate transport system ATPase subunit